MAGPVSKRMPSPALAGAMIFLLAGAVLGHDGQDRKPRWSFGILFENDIFARSDGGYTNGAKFILVSPDRGAGTGAGKFVSFSLSQIISTPEDIKKTELLEDDRPYAGVLYAEIGFHTIRADSMDSFELLVGILGPDSMAGGIQRFLHRTFGWTYPRGWGNQLKDEALLGCFYDHKWKLGGPVSEAGRAWDLITHAGAGLSNLWTGLDGGLEFRIGRNLPGDFGASTISPSGNAGSILDAGGGSSRGYYFFASLDGHAVARDILFDGNTLRSGPRVKKLPFTADIALGGALRRGRFRAAFSYVYQTKRFKAEKLKPFFGALSLAWVF
jgi:lipid A 3-O-deacylase